MGVDGVAIATIVSQYLSAIMSVVYLAKTSGPLRISLKEMKIDWQKVKKILYIGVPSGIQSSLFSLSNVLIQSSVNSLGEAVVAGSAASSNIESFMYVAMNSVYHVSLTFVGQNAGARKFKNIRRIMVYASLIVSVIGIGMGALLILLREPLLGLYISSPDALEAATMRFMIIAPTYFMCGLMEVFCGGLRALDKSVTAMIVSLVGACGLRILWIETIFRLSPSPQSIFISYPVTWFITASCQLLFVIITARKLIKENERIKGSIT
jgi:Na+-driven multidrug efflux pump